jgi:hypothetical protein
MPWSIRIFVSRFSTFPSFIFSSAALSGFCVPRVFRGHALIDPFRT